MAYPFQKMTTRELLILSGEKNYKGESLVYIGSFPSGDQEVKEKPPVKLLPVINTPSSKDSPQYLPTEHRS
jgi:hypothetical protein